MAVSETRTITTPDVRFSVRVRGDGPAVLFVHGFGGDAASWEALWQALPAGRTYIAPDLRGFGQSVATGDDAFSHTNDLAALLDGLGIERCDLVGLSMGGAIALNFAIRFPRRVHRLALVSPAMTAWEWSDEWRSLWHVITRAARAGDMAEAKRLWGQHPLFVSTRESAAAAMLADEILRFSGVQWVEDRQEAALPDVERLHEIDRPILLLSGGRDMADFRLIADIIAASAAHVTRRDRADLGHLLHMEDPHWCAGQLAAFWAAG
ncbi:Pimeloyl-ACP methyl ester carboxylesterase [Sphingomonas laterariae]|uniref:Pimeloyl-ACP methyl ester carboxylesterase n=1 Tax=Edaphosphingomonas laterariae TaxID=861865 RepID=A0A239HCA9_9SPHN|nr:alpha/beta fold hydrolase [Sphingomonas laterariae]SNS79066.1 Pimeloyl-ACP methyl ester carboxylesterase [Sphingomonas laterariae]